MPYAERMYTSLRENVQVSSNLSTTHHNSLSKDLVRYSCLTNYIKRQANTETSIAKFLLIHLSNKLSGFYFPYHLGFSEVVSKSKACYFFSPNFKLYKTNLHAKLILHQLQTRPLKRFWEIYIIPNILAGYSGPPD